MKYIILDNIRSAHNVGAIFRTAEGAGVAKIFLTGYTPRPVDRFGRSVAEIVKTSLGASDLVPWTANENIDEVIAELRAEQVQIVAVEITPEAVSLYDFRPQQSVAYIFGNEVTGVSPEVCAQTDVVLQIPMQGKKESLNVATTAGIVLFHYQV
jgi:23S rRNA (guanosine2251-2'-O)-methyltransferase